MVAQDDEFIRLTFEGGRFSLHSMPVDVLAEFKTLQQLVETVARHRFLAQNLNRKNVPSGFAEAARLHLVGTEHNCFSAILDLPKADAEKYAIFKEARDLTVAALVGLGAGSGIPVGFPAEALARLAPLGQRLEDDEHIVLFKGRDKHSGVRIDQDLRERVAKLIRRPLQRVENLEGEIVSIDDTGRFSIQSPAGIVVVPFSETRRAQIINAFAMRPIARVNVRGLLEFTAPKKIVEIDEIEIVDDERAPDVRTLWNRLESFSEIQDGWYEGDGLCPSADSIARARGVLARLMIEYRDLPKPRVYPTRDGNVQAEWVLGRWAVDVLFGPTDDSIQADATHIDSGQEIPTGLFSSEQVSADAATSLADWLKFIAE